MAGPSVSSCDGGSWPEALLATIRPLELISQSVYQKMSTQPYHTIILTYNFLISGHLCTTGKMSVPTIGKMRAGL